MPGIKVADTSTVATSVKIRIVTAMLSPGPNSIRRSATRPPPTSFLPEMTGDRWRHYTFQVILFASIFEFFCDVDEKMVVSRPAHKNKTLERRINRLNQSATSKWNQTDLRLALLISSHLSFAPASLHFIRGTMIFITKKWNDVGTVRKKEEGDPWRRRWSDWSYRRSWPWSEAGSRSQFTRYRSAVRSGSV